MKIAVIGAGVVGGRHSRSSWHATATEVGLWARKPEVVDAVNASHANPRYLSEVELSPRIVARPPTRRPWRARRPPSS